MLKAATPFMCLVAFAGCTTPQAKPQPVVVVKQSLLAAGDPIDLDKLQQALGLDGSREDFGFTEKSFGTCEIGYGFNRNRDCRMQYLVVLRFRLQCREHDGNGGEPVDSQAIHALDTVTVKWLIGKAQGSTQTDADGYGVVRMLASRSQKREHAKLTVDGRFLILRAEDLGRVVTPSEWCGKYR